MPKTLLAAQVGNLECLECSRIVFESCGAIPPLLWRSLALLKKKQTQNGERASADAEEATVFSLQSLL